MTFKIKDGLSVNNVTIIDGSGNITSPGAFNANSTGGINVAGSVSGNTKIIAAASPNNTLTLPTGSGTVALFEQIPEANNALLTVQAAGSGLSGSGTFTANASVPSTITITSNATSANTASTIVLRDGTGSFTAGNITASLIGNVTGNSTTATALQTVRTINGTNFNGSANITTTYWGTPRALTLGSTGKNVDGTADVTWQLAEIGVPSTTGVGATGTWGINISGTAGAVAWTNVTSRPSALQSFSNDLGYYVPSSDIAPDWNSLTTKATYRITAIGTNGPSATGTGTAIVYGGSVGGLTQVYHSSAGELRFRTNYSSSWSAWRTALTDGNYNSYAPTLSGAGASGTWAINISGTAAGVAWTNVSGRPTTVSAFTNDSGYITAAGRAYPRRSDGGDLNFYWSGQSGQPTWLWGGTDGNNMYVYNPSNFSVSYAASAGAVTWGAVTGKPNVATHRGEGTNYIDYARLVYNNGAYSGSGWNEPSDLGVRYAASAGNADSVDGQHFAWQNASNAPTYLWAADSNGSAYLAHRPQISVNYANSAGQASSASYAGALVGGCRTGPGSDFVVDGTCYTGALYSYGNVSAYSDERMKKDWEPVASNLVDKMADVKTGIYTLIRTDERSIGVSAQSLREAMPNAVAEDENGMLSVVYGNAALVLAIELAKEVRELRAMIETLTKT